MSENKARTMAELGLVSRTIGGYLVQMPGFGAPQYKVTRPASVIYCTCGIVGGCIHSLAVCLAVQMGTVTEPKEPVAAAAVSPRKMEEIATPKQLTAIRVIAFSKGLNPDEECQRAMGCFPEELSRKAASRLIDHLKNVSPKAQVA